MSARRVRIRIEGAVQGVGFRPFVHRLAAELGLTGRVRNEGSRVVVEAQGPRVGELEGRLRAEHPPHARIETLQAGDAEAVDEEDFRIAGSTAAGGAPAVVPDLVTCPACREEILDPVSRYHRYPFTSCTRCGPRFSIVERVPYDRVNTTMARFPLCPACRAAYEDPADRRFHAQTTACPACGPRAGLVDAGGAAVTTADPVHSAAAALRRGRIVALKGLGGFQLLVDATDVEAVRRLRDRKGRPHKPFAVMVRDVGAARALASVHGAEAALLRSPAGPIVLLARRGDALPREVAPDPSTLGLMLPTTPLHHLLLGALDRPLVCTSGNRDGEPLCTGNAEARERLGGVAELFLLHDRPIRRALDDSVVQLVDGAPQVLRLGRGLAPRVLPLPGAVPALSCGAHLKSAPAVAGEGRLVVGPHVGDLESARAVDAFERTARDLAAFFAVRIGRAACDAHPDYASTRFAETLGVPVTRVPHHLAHALACMAEHELHGPLLAVTWDGAGLGPDGTVWGGEFLRVARTRAGVRWQRVAHLRPFRLPGGDATARDARRALAGLLWEIDGLRSEVPPDLARLLERDLCAPWCSSAGRLFDGVAALLGLCGRQSYEGRAAARLEAAVEGEGDGFARLALRDGRLDWTGLVASLHREHGRGVPAGVLAARFHRALAQAVVDVARTAGASSVVLTGGCFQNRRLGELALSGLRAAGLEARIPRLLPPNDGGVAAGQMVAAQEGIGKE